MKNLKGYLLALAMSFAAFAQVDTNSQHFYLFTYFLNLQQDLGARIALSSDGINWQKINNEAPLFTPTISSEHLMRDPFTYFDPLTGVFHLVWTAGWTQRGIGYTSVQDLRYWHDCVQQVIPVGAAIPDCACCWSPEIFYDDIKDSLMIYWSTERGINGKKIYYCMTKDFKTFSNAKLFFDPGYSVIDADILKVGNGKYYLFFKDERSSTEAGKQSKNIHYVYGPTPQGPWTPAAGSNAITNVGCEGPSAIKIGNEYRVYFDPYSDFSLTNRMIKVTDLNTTTFPWPQGDVLKTSTGNNFLFSHGNVTEISRAKVMQLLTGAQDTTPYAPSYAASFCLKGPLNKLKMTYQNNAFILNIPITFTGRTDMAVYSISGKICATSSFIGNGTVRIPAAVSKNIYIVVLKNKAGILKSSIFAQ